MTSLMVLRPGSRLSGTYARGLKSPSRHEIGQSGECECLSLSVIGMSSLLVVFVFKPIRFEWYLLINARQVSAARCVVDRVLPCAVTVVLVGEVAAKRIH